MATTSKRYFTKTPVAAAAAPKAPRKPRAKPMTVEDAVIVDHICEGRSEKARDCEAAADALKGRFAERIDPVAEQPSEATHGAYERMQEAVDDYLKAEGIVDWKRQLINCTLGLIGYGASLYFMVQIVEVLATAVMLYAGVGFLSFMVAFVGLMLAFIAAWGVGGFVYQIAAKFDVSAASTRVRGWFKRNDMEAQHA